MSRAALRAEGHDAAPAKVWSQSRFGNALDLVEPRAEQVDFAEIAVTLAHIPRYAGSSNVPVSVAQHTLIAVECAPAELAPWILLHDAHEYALGDWTTPAVQALCHFADQLEPSGGVLVGLAVHRAKLAHDRAIHAAARLPMPTADQARGIQEADRRALMTERALFLARPPRPWHAALEAIRPLGELSVANRKARKPMECADALLEAFRRKLPALKDLRA